MDCAAVVDALTYIDGTDRLRARMTGQELHAPHLLDYEVVSAVRGLRIGGHLSDSRARDVLTDFDELPVRRWSAYDAHRRQALQLGDNLSTYDAAYVSLAEVLGCPLLTRDARLSRASGHDAHIEVL